jgi:hypothetical protein
MFKTCKCFLRRHDFPHESVPCSRAPAVTVHLETTGRVCLFSKRQFRGVLRMANPTRGGPLKCVGPYLVIEEEYEMKRRAS